MKHQFKKGDRVYKARKYSMDDYCRFGGREDMVPLGTIGVVDSCANSDKIRVVFDVDVQMLWTVDPSEIESGDSIVQNLSFYRETIYHSDFGPIITCVEDFILVINKIKEYCSYHIDTNIDTNKDTQFFKRLYLQDPIGITVVDIRGCKVTLHKQDNKQIRKKTLVSVDTFCDILKHDYESRTVYRGSKTASETIANKNSNKLNTKIDKNERFKQINGTSIKVQNPTATVSRGKRYEGNNIQGTTSRTSIKSGYNCYGAKPISA